jgi:hypothetical protein
MHSYFDSFFAPEIVVLFTFIFSGAIQRFDKYQGTISGIL